MKEFKIKSRTIGAAHPVFIIAEAGINHNGSYKIARKLVDVAKKAEVDCIKFQTHIAEKEMIAKNLHFNIDQFLSELSINFNYLECLDEG